MMPSYRNLRLTFCFLAATALTLLIAGDSRGQESKPAPLEGAWKVVESKNGDAADYQKPAEGTETIKFVAGGRFMWVVNQGGKVVSGLGGKYKIDKDKYSETIDYALGEGTESLVGKTFEFTWKLDGKTWLHVGTITVNGQEIKIDEKWERCAQ